MFWMSKPEINLPFCIAAVTASSTLWMYKPTCQFPWSHWATVTPWQALQGGPGESGEKGLPGRHGELQQGPGIPRAETGGKQANTHTLASRCPQIHPSGPDTLLSGTHEEKGGRWNISEVFGLCLTTLMRGTSPSITIRPCHVL